MRVKDIGQSKTWYEKKLELKTIWEDMEAKLVVLDTGGPTSLTLWQTSEPINQNKGTASYPIFRTQDAKVARAALTEKGVQADEVTKDGVITFFNFYDPDGNILEACQVHE
ncbi:VOC family protein [Cytophagales bacterium RKSG123]|nr:VOC family protein [Xanthovirga aplysinae]